MVMAQGLLIYTLLIFFLWLYIYVCRFAKMFDENTTCLYLSSIAMRWLAVRIDTLAGNVYTLDRKADLKVFIPVLLSDQ